MAVIIFSKKNHLRLWSCADIVALASPPGLFLGRVANFINAELWGRPTQMPWGVIFPGEIAQNCPEIIGLCARHPSQLYEAFLEGILLFIILLIFANRHAFLRPGLVTGVFIFGYGVSRFVVEYYRVPDQQFFSEFNPNGYIISFADFGFSMGQLLCFPMVFIGVLLMLLSRENYENMARSK